MREGMTLNSVFLDNWIQEARFFENPLFFSFVSWYRIFDLVIFQHFIFKVILFFTIYCMRNHFPYQIAIFSSTVSF